MEWFPDQQRCQQWGGPEFRFPFTQKTFFEDCGWEQIASFVLTDDDNPVLGFGQYYERLGHCHLGRLAIHPLHRHRGHGMTLVTALADAGMTALKINQCSLFVLTDNPAAIGLYRKLGFEPAEYTADDIVLENFFYMTASHQSIMAWRQSYPCHIEDS